MAEPVVARLWVDLQYARQKDRVEDLTPDEGAAICYFAGVPYQYDKSEGKMLMKFAPCGLVREGGGWRAIVAP